MALLAACLSAHRDPPSPFSAWALSRNAPSTTICSPAAGPTGLRPRRRDRGRGRCVESRSGWRPWAGTRTIRCARAAPPPREPSGSARRSRRPEPPPSPTYRAAGGCRCSSRRFAPGRFAIPIRPVARLTRRFLRSPAREAPGNESRAIDALARCGPHPARRHARSATASRDCRCGTPVMPGSSIWPTTALRSITDPLTGEHEHEVRRRRLVAVIGGRFDAERRQSRRAPREPLHALHRRSIRLPALREAARSSRRRDCACARARPRRA